MKEFRDALTSNTLSYSEKCSRAKLEKAIYEFLQSKQAVLQASGCSAGQEKEKATIQ